MKKKVLLTTILMTAICLGQNPSHDDVAEAWQFQEARQFDFWIGEWDVNLRRIQEDNTWVDWKKSKAHIHRILNGRAILELWEEQSSDLPQNTIVGYSLRYYDQQLKKWVLWLNWPGVNQSGSTTLTGTFRHNRGEFFKSQALNDSTELLSRYTFSDITPNALRWDDTFSKDGGKTWANNWVMEFARTAELPRNLEGEAIHTFRKGERCPREEFAILRELVGEWQGTLKRKSANWTEDKATLRAHRALGGCAVMGFLESEGTSKPYEEFNLYTFNTYANRYEVGSLNNGPSSTYASFFGNFNDDKQLVMHMLDQSSGTLKETVSWVFLDDDRLKIEKWAYDGEEQTKTLEAMLSRTSGND